MMSAHGANPIFLIKKVNVGFPEHFLTPHALSLIASLFNSEYCKIRQGTLSGLRQFWANEGPLKMMKNVFYFSFRSQDISVFVLTFWSCIITALLER